MYERKKYTTFCPKNILLFWIGKYTTKKHTTFQDWLVEVLFITKLHCFKNIIYFFNYNKFVVVPQ